MQTIYILKIFCIYRKFTSVSDKCTECAYYAKIYKKSKAERSLQYLMDRTSLYLGSISSAAFIKGWNTMNICSLTIAVIEVNEVQEGFSF